MHISHLLILMEESGLTPEELGPRFGVSGMTIRRWLKKPKGFTIGEPYVSAIHQLIREFIVESRLDAGSRIVMWSLETNNTQAHEATLRLLGVENLRLSPDGGLENQDEQVLVVLQKIGEKQDSYAKVEEGAQEISRHKKHNPEWSKRISGLMSIVRSRTLPSIEKFVAVGALFYLLFPADLIPDALPVFGLVDDFAILGIASNYYLKKPQRG